MKEGREKLFGKVMCSKKSGIEKIICCDKLWTKKTGEARRKQQEEGEEEKEDIRIEKDANDGKNLDKEESRASENLRQEEKCGELKQEEILKYRKHQYKENPTMRLIPADIEIVMGCDHCGPEITELALHKCEECEDSWVAEDYTLCILGNDVISLFPSLDSEGTGKIVRKEVQQ